MKYVLCKEINEVNIPLVDKEENLLIFDTDIEANIERIYLQPDYDENLKVMPTKLGEN